MDCQHFFIWNMSVHSRYLIYFFLASCSQPLLMLRSLRINRKVVLLQVGCLLVFAFARSFQAYPEWPQPNSYVDGPVQRYFVFFPPNKRQRSKPSSPWAIIILLAFMAFGCFPCFFCVCNTMWPRRRRSRTVRDRRREEQALSLERGALPHRRSSAGFDTLAHASIRSETGSSARVVSLDSAHPEFRPSAPAPPADFNNSYEEPHLVSFKMKEESAKEPCGICLEPYGVVDVTAGQCSHVFHTACLKAWLAKEVSQKLCPLCRSPFHNTAQHSKPFESIPNNL